MAGRVTHVEVFRDDSDEWTFAPVDDDGRGEAEDLSQYGPYELDAVQAMATARAIALGVKVVVADG